MGAYIEYIIKTALDAVCFINLSASKEVAVPCDLATCFSATNAIARLK